MTDTVIPVGTTGKFLRGVDRGGSGIDEYVVIADPVSGTGLVPLTDAALRAAPVPVSGTVATGGLTDTQLRATPVPVSGTVTSTPSSATTGANTSVAATVTPSTTILASNTSRKGASVYNESSAILYLSRGATCTTTSYSVQIPPGGYYELLTSSRYNGIVTGVWASATGNARVTEDT